MRAVDIAIGDRGYDMRPFADGQTVKVVNKEDVRHVFYEIRADEICDESRRSAFARALRQAIERELLFSRERGGEVFIWKPAD